MENPSNITEKYNYQTWLSSNCPGKYTCIGFARPVQTETGNKPCTAIYSCPFTQEQKWERDTSPRH